jgi:hypothetical protein
MRVQIVDYWSDMGHGDCVGIFGGTYEDELVMKKLFIMGKQKWKEGRYHE